MEGLVLPDNKEMCPNLLMNIPALAWQFLLLEVDEEAGVYAVLLPLIDRQTFRATLRPARYVTFWWCEELRVEYEERGREPYYKGEWWYCAL